VFPLQLAVIVELFELYTPELLLPLLDKEAPKKELLEKLPEPLPQVTGPPDVCTTDVNVFGSLGVYPALLKLSVQEPLGDGLLQESDVVIEYIVPQLALLSLQ